MLTVGSFLLALLPFMRATAAGTATSSPSQTPTIIGGQWTWASGLDHSPEVERYGIYGTKGVAAPTNAPGAREAYVSWTDANGNFWLFGGEGYAATQDGKLNDLWRWDGTSWTWIAGSKEAGAFGSYGTKGVAAPGNVPGARTASVSWTDAAGNFWLFGGTGYARDGLGALNDLWKWDGTRWTWVSGSDSGGQVGVYGTKGLAAPGNVPGARSNSVSWSDASGALWLFGGYAYLHPGFGFAHNDLWKWDGANWTWVSGSNGQNQPGTYGTKGVAAPGNVPGARQSAVSWVDTAGKLWLFGGYGYSNAQAGFLNDLWKWDGTTWTWVSGSDAPDQLGLYGTKGEGAPGNAPGARRSSVAWRDASGGLWLFGGAGFAAEYGGNLNDLWTWDGTNWTWVSGSDVPAQKGTYGTRGSPAPANVPGGRSGSGSWRDGGGNLWLFGGVGFSAIGYGRLNDLWKWDGTNWTWVGGPSGESLIGVSGTKGVPSPANLPRPRYLSASWTDSSGNLWLFGGSGFVRDGFDGQLSDFWRWDGANWTWMGGSDRAYQYGVYGTKGVPSPANMPGARCCAVTWTDPSGALWLFGGHGAAAAGSGSLNDLWKWDGTNWTWMSGSDAPGSAGAYGAKGVPAPGNVPSARTFSVSWTDAAGSLWLFGGNTRSSDGFDEWRNDLWRWDGTNWTWVSGSDQPDQLGDYGTKGVAAPGNVPGARSHAVSWTNESGNLWLFGGSGVAAASSGHLNDLWKWDGANWTWVSGSDLANQTGEYGTKGVTAPGNGPGGRYSSSSWQDASGNFWLFGGVFGNGFFGGMLSDLWRWDGKSWTWVSGSSVPSQMGTYGTLGVPTEENSPGARTYAASWTDASGTLWLFGGLGLSESGRARLSGKLNDLWAFGTTCAVVAPPAAGNGGPYGTGATIRLSASAVPGATYLWKGPGGFTSTIQNPTIPNATLAMAGAYSVVMIVGGCASAPSETKVEVVPGQMLTVSKSGAGNGLVSSDPAGIDCGSVCESWFPGDSFVTLTAVAEADSRFAGWAGAGCAGTNPCSVTKYGTATVSAMFLPTGGVGFHALLPCRIVDTRNAAGPYGGPALAAGAARAFAIGGRCGVPVDASAVALNVTVANPAAPGSLTVFPGTGVLPDSSAMAFPAGRTRANNAIIGLIDGMLTVFDQQDVGTTDLIIDVSGYFR